MVHAQESAHVNEFNKTAEWLNQFQIMTKIGVTPEQVKVDPVAQALLKATLESLPVRDHEIQALAQQNMKQYEWSHDVKGVRFVQGELGSHSHRLCPQVLPRQRQLQ